MANNDYSDNDSDADDLPSEQQYTAAFRPVHHHQPKKHRYEKRKKLKRPTNILPDTYLSPPNQKYDPDAQFKRKQSIPITSRTSDVTNQTPVLIGGDDAPYTEHPTSKNGFTPIHLPPKNAPRSAPSKVLIKRVNYNYHPIIDFFFRDRAAKTAKAKENRAGHSIVS